MSKTLLDTLKEKYGDEYNIEQVEIFHQYNITEYHSEDGNEIYKLRIKLNNDINISETWHTSTETILYKLLNI